MTGWMKSLCKVLWNTVTLAKRYISAVHLLFASCCLWHSYQELVLVTSVFSITSWSLSPHVASSVMVVSGSSTVVSVTLTSVICDCSRIPFSPAGSCEMEVTGSGETGSNRRAQQYQHCPLEDIICSLKLCSEYSTTNLKFYLIQPR